MRNVLVLGAGKIGGAIAKLLSNSGGYDVAVADTDADAMARLHKAAPNISRTSLVDVTRDGELRNAMSDREAVISALPYSLNRHVADAAIEGTASYFDLTEDVATTNHIRCIAPDADPGQIFMPQCGLAPGFVCIAANSLAKGFDKLDEVKMRVGALPRFPSNSIKYNLTWSTDGLINEYCNMCDAIHDGERIKVLPLEGLERLSLDGTEYEAFNTSGGLGTLCETLESQGVRELNYKTIRYVGHRDLISFLVNDLRLSSRRQVLKDILEGAVPSTTQDVVIVFCSATGWEGGRLVQVTDARKIHGRRMFGEEWGAIQLTTAAGVCCAVDLHFSHRLPIQGFVRQEQVDLETLLSNRFGQYYATALGGA